VRIHRVPASAGLTETACPCRPETASCWWVPGRARGRAGPARFRRKAHSPPCGCAEANISRPCGSKARHQTPTRRNQRQPDLHLPARSRPRPHRRRRLHPHQMLRHPAEQHHKYLSKGRLISLTGRISHSQWKDKETGDPRERYEVIDSCIGYLDQPRSE